MKIYLPSPQSTKAQEDFELRYNILPQAIEDEVFKKRRNYNSYSLKS
jgi:hypothetical protein